MLYFLPASWIEFFLLLETSMLVWIKQQGLVNVWNVYASGCFGVWHDAAGLRLI
jgi:hypothetical protein